ncbi:MAG: hypothetical protein QW379_06715 [Thermoplasmata archaeon]
MPDEAAADWSVKYKEQTARLAKLWDAYEKQEKELAAVKERVSALEAELADRERIIKSLKDVLEARDRRVRELEIELTGLRNEKNTWDPKLRNLENELRIERERYAKLFALAEELEEEVRAAKRGIEARDEWFRTHIDIFANFSRAIEERERMIAQAGKVEGPGRAELEKMKRT